MFTTVCVGNAIGAALMLMVFLTNKSMNFKGIGNKYLNSMTVVTILSCIADIVAFGVDGKEGTLVNAVIYIVNSWLFFAVILNSNIWIRLICDCVGVRESLVARTTVQIINIVAVTVLLVNLFCPIVFSVNENNVYQRERFYWLFVAIGFFNMVHGMLFYCNARRKGELLVPFSIWAFVFPVAVATVIQSLFYGISVIWPGNAIAVAGMVASMKNELILIDRLTGVYNRYYLTRIEKINFGRNNKEVTGLMLDINHFKYINDMYGHKVGDEALVHTAEILTDAVANCGKVVRYAGDEFIVILSSSDKEEVSATVERINRGFEKFNENHPDGYQLTVAIGYHTFNFEKESLEEILNIIDADMYADKHDKHETAAQNNPAE